MRSLRFFSFLAVAMAAAPLAQSSRPSAAELAAKVQAHYATVKDFTADFTQTQKSSLSPKAVIERGDVAIKKPLKMRWNYATNEKNQFISDGVKLYSVFPQGKYVSVSDLPREGEQSTWLLFLAGRGDLTRDFAPSLPADQPGSTEWRLLLKPAPGRKADFQTLTLEVDRTSYQLRGLVVIDEVGATNAYRFTNLRENRNVGDRTFVFEIPKGFALKYQ